MAQLGQALENARTTKRLSVTAAAKALGTYPATFRAWRRNQKPEPERWATIADFIGVAEADIMVMLRDSDGLTRPYVNSELAFAS